MGVREVEDGVKMLSSLGGEKRGNRDGEWRPERERGRRIETK
jgi:hypothetical protein